VAKAILLLSGGLDSVLAGKMLLEMSVEVEAVTFTTPFCQCQGAARTAAEQLAVPLRIVECQQNYLETMKHPKFGFGANANACIDCHLFFLRQAKVLLEAEGVDFLATGEVLGERPMSQRREAMELIEREAGLEGRIVRPLSGQLLPPTEAERRGLIRREQLGAIQGRCRQPQFAMAAKFGITEYQTPAGGCLLTDPEFSQRFRDLLEHEPEFGVSDAALLRYGRHFRLPSGAKVVCGRNAAENPIIEGSWREGDRLLVPGVGGIGPSVLCRGARGEEDVALAAGILRAYAKAAPGVAVRDPRSGAEEVVAVTGEGAERAEFARFRVGSASG
jgi:tRNA U34 2-thiouridine synthase MnmA/TrmU